jgi:hypothetical protein
MPSDRVRRTRRPVESVGARGGVRVAETRGEDVRRGGTVGEGGAEAAALTVEERGAGGHRTRPTANRAQRVQLPKERVNSPYRGFESLVGLSSLVMEAR